MCIFFAVDTVTTNDHLIFNVASCFISYSDVHLNLNLNKPAIKATDQFFFSVNVWFYIKGGEKRSLIIVTAVTISRYRPL